MMTPSEPSGRGSTSLRIKGRIGGSQLFDATLTIHCSSTARRSSGIPCTKPSSATPRKTTPPSALENATSSPAMSSVWGPKTERSPNRISLSSARESSPARSWSRISSFVSNIGWRSPQSSSPNDLMDTLHPIPLHQPQQLLVDPPRQRRSLVDEGGVDLHQGGPGPQPPVRLGAGVDPPDADEDCPTEKRRRHGLEDCEALLA